MSTFAKCAALLAVFAVVWVLITPAFDELPSTAAHRLPLLLSSLPIATAALMQLLPSAPGMIYAAKQFPGVLDVRSLTCALLC